MHVGLLPLISHQLKVAKVILDTGLSSLRLTQVRLTGAAVVLVAVLAIVRPDALRVQRRELPMRYPDFEAQR